VTEVNGFRLAYRGLVAGLAAGWVWLAIALAGLLLAGTNPLGATRALGTGTDSSGLIVALALAQTIAGGIGLVFAYFFGRYFTARPTLAVAAPVFAVLCWLAVANLTNGAGLGWVAQAVLIVAAAVYGLILGSALPTRGEVLRGARSTDRYSAGSPST
jgi:hypothetical protein